MDDTAADLGYLGSATHGARNRHAEIMISGSECGSQCLWSCLFSLSSGTFLIHSPSSYKPWLLVSQHRLYRHPQKWKEKNKAVTKTVLLKHPWHVNHLGYFYNTDYDSLYSAWGLNSAFLTSSDVLLMLQICGLLWVARTHITRTCDLISWDEILALRRLGFCFLSEGLQWPGEIESLWLSSPSLQWMKSWHVGKTGVFIETWRQAVSWLYWSPWFRWLPKPSSIPGSLVQHSCRLPVPITSSLCLTN